MEVVVLLGRRADDPIPTFLLSICPSIIITLYVSSRSRIVWRELEPCLLGRCSSRRIASGDDDDDSSKVARRRMLLCILSHYYHNCYKPTNSSTVVIEETLKEQETNNQQCRQENDDDDGSKNQFQLCHHKRRRIRLGQKLLDRVLPSSSSVSYPSQKLYLYIQPPRTTSLHFEYLWENKLIHLEHKLILATSMAGLYSTLGGGCFMTRRMSTAILLARQQQRMALILNDMDMYYKSQINASYNLIYIGQFQAARTLLRQVRRAVQQEIGKSVEVAAALGGGNSNSNGSLAEENSDKQDHCCDNEKCRSAVILIRMCRAARRFSKRVEKAASTVSGKEHVASNNAVDNNARPNTVDDYARIRLVQDQSSSTDLIRLIS